VRRAVGLFCLFLASMLLRAWISSHVAVVANDAAGGYLYQAREILRGNWREGLGTYFPPGYPLLVALLSCLPLGVDTAGKIISVVSGSLLILPVFFLGKRLFGEPSAWAAAALACFYPLLVEHSSDAVSEGLYTLVLLLATSLAVQLLRSSSPRQGVCLGLLYGWCYLIRGEALFLMALFILVGTALHLIRRFRYGTALHSEKWVLVVIWVLVGFGALAFPYAVFLRSQTGSWSLSGKTMENLLSYDITDDGVAVDLESTRNALSPDGMHLQMELAKRESAISFLWQHRSREMKRYRLNGAEAYLEFLPRAVYPLYLMMLAIGLFSALAQREFVAENLFLATVFSFPMVFYPLFLIEIRYFAPVVPIALIWVGYGLASLSQELVRGFGVWRGKEGWLLGILVVGMVGLHAWPLKRLVQVSPDYYALEHKRAGEWLAEHGRPHARIMNRKSYVAFYASGVPLITPDEDFEKILFYARAQAVDYLVVDDRFTLAVRKQLAFLLNSNQIPADLERVYVGDPVRGRRIAIFAIRAGGG
jgi:dolichyl-phosphate-mannose-protein mannosyltransferase